MGQANSGSRRRQTRHPADRSRGGGGGAAITHSLSKAPECPSWARPWAGHWAPGPVRGQALSQDTDVDGDGVEWWLRSQGRGPRLELRPRRSLSSTERRGEGIGLSRPPHTPLPHSDAVSVKSRFPQHTFLELLLSVSPCSGRWGWCTNQTDANLTCLGHLFQ